MFSGGTAQASHQVCHFFLSVLCAFLCVWLWWIKTGELRKLWDSLSELRSSVCERQLEGTVMRPALCQNCAVYSVFSSGKTSHSKIAQFNPLNVELNAICHLLLLLGYFTFMGPCIVSIFQYTCISNKMQHYIVCLYLETALHVLGGTSIHHQERIQPYLQHLVFFTPLFLSAAIVKELEPVWVCCGWRAPPTTHSNLYMF
jgi:hypothetical protein